MGYVTIFHARTETQYLVACGTCTRGTGDLLTGRASRVTCQACRQAGKAAQNAQRDRAILTARAAGEPVRVIAARFGFGRDRVRVICLRERKQNGV